MRKALQRVLVSGLAALLLASAPAWAESAPVVAAALLADAGYHDALVKRIRESKRRIICAFYLFKVGDRRDNRPAVVVAELLRAKRRGVDVTVILEGDRPVGRDNRGAAGALARGGVKVLLPAGKRVVHAKAVVVDDRYVLIGSHNLTHAALTRNKELSVFLDSPDLAAQTTRYLEGIR